MYIADFGDGSEKKNLLDQIRKFIQSGGKANVIIILQPSFIDQVGNMDEVLSGLQELAKVDPDILSKAVVIPFSKPQHLPLVAKLRELKIGVHRSADDGACFVEVHKPDGIVVGMPGKPFEN